MYTVNKDLSIYVTRGDAVMLAVGADNNGVPYVFQTGEIVRFRVFEKKGCHCTVLQKDFVITEAVESVDIVLTKEETKFGEIISKPKDYWYEIELNPNYNPQTIVGYDDEGPKVFRLFPEGADVDGGEGEAPDAFVPAIPGRLLPYVTEEDNGKTVRVVNGEWELAEDDKITVDDALSTVSENPVQNKVITDRIIRAETGVAAANATAEAAQETATQAMEALADVPIKYVESPDADGNIVCLRDLASGTYVLKGNFEPYWDSKDLLQLGDQPYFTIVVRGYNTDGVNISNMQMFNPYNNMVRHCVITDTTYDERVIAINDLASKQVVEEMITAVENTAEQAKETADQTAEGLANLATAVNQYAHNQRIVNARDFGAKGDGVTDDTEAIQNALHYAEDYGWPLYIPAGNYLVSKTISTYTRDTDSDKQSKVLNIYGSGMSTVFTTTEDFDGDYVFYIDVAGVQPRMLWVHDFAVDLNADVSGIYFNEIGMKSAIENLWITFNYLKQETDTTVRAGIYCHKATVTTFQRIKVSGNVRGLDGTRPMNCGIVCNFMHSTKIIDCDVTFCGWGIYLSGGTNNLIENCRIDENEYGLYQNSSTDVETATRAYKVDEIPDSFKGTFGNLTIRKNRFEGNNQVAVCLIAFGVGELNYMYNAQITIADNNFTGLGAGTAMWHDDREVFRRAMRFGRCKGIAIIGNKFKGMPYDSKYTLSVNQNISIPTFIEDLTLRDNVAITWPYWTDDTTYTIVKTNTKVSSDIVSQLNFINDIEANQTTRQDIAVRRNKPDVIKSSGTASVARSNVVYVEDGVTISGVSVESSSDLTCNQEVTFIARGNVTIKCTSSLLLNGGVDFAMGLYDTLTVVCLYNNNARRWVEKSRSVNRAI